MAVSAEPKAGGLNLSNLRLAKGLQKRLWFTLGALVVFRMLSFVPLPGIDPRALAALFDTTRGGVLDFFNIFSGGGLERMSLIALGVMPYITASIVMQLAASMSPTLAALKKEGESGRKKLNQYTRYGTVFLCVVQGYFIAVGLEGWGVDEGRSAVLEPGIMFRITTVINLVGGTMFLMWLGEQVTSRGVGNGVSLIIMAGIVAQLPMTVMQALEGGRTGSISPTAIVAVLAFAAVLVLFICFMELAQRRVLIQYPKRRTDRGGLRAERSHLPLKINAANVIPPIFASSLLLMPLTIVQFAGQGQTGDSAWGDFLIAVSTALQHGAPLYMGLYAVGIIYFTFFYTNVVFNPEETAENLKKYGGFIPGIRPGRNTEDYLRYVLTRITVIGAAYLTLICVVPEYFIARAGIPFYLGGTSLLIVVNVTMDTVSQIQSHLMAHQYGDLIRKAKLKGRTRGDARAAPREEPRDVAGLAARRSLPLRTGREG
jgi:preprotein translocase subunit SecY